MPPSAVTAHLATPLLGVSAGLRSVTPLAVTSWFARTGQLPLEGTWAAWLARPAVVAALTIAAVGEELGDKSSSTPNRTAPVPLVGRLILGGLAGSAVATALRRPVAGGAAMGALGAAAGTYASFYARRGLTKGAGLADLPVGITGDAAAVALAIRALRRLTS